MIKVSKEYMYKEWILEQEQDEKSTNNHSNTSVFVSEVFGNDKSSSYKILGILKCCYPFYVMSAVFISSIELSDNIYFSRLSNLASCSLILFPIC